MRAIDSNKVSLEVNRYFLDYRNLAFYVYEMPHGLYMVDGGDAEKGVNILKSFTSEYQVRSFLKDYISKTYSVNVNVDIENSLIS